jgi:hypothetical protein
MSQNEQQMDFFKFMDDTIKREEAKKNIVLPTGEQKEPYNPNREYQKLYSHRVYDRMWIGNRRY